MMTEALALAALAAGFFGSGHCVGMCGAVVTLLETPPDAPGAWRRRFGNNAGRLCTYALLGTLAGAAGQVLAATAGVGYGLMALRLLAALLLGLLAVNLLFGLRSLHFLESAGYVLWRRLAPLARHVFPATTLPRAFAAGALWGALPCGLVYSAVALAATAGTAPGGALVMLLFWAGTLPALLATGAMARQASAMARYGALRRGAGGVLLVVAILGLLLPFWHGMHPDGHRQHEDAQGTQLHDEH